MNFVTVTNVTKPQKQVVKLLGIPEEVQSNFSIAVHGDKWLTPYTMLEVNKMQKD
jgi:ferrochelatase